LHQIKLNYFGGKKFNLIGFSKLSFFSPINSNNYEIKCSAILIETIILIFNTLIMHYVGILYMSFTWSMKKGKQQYHKLWNLYLFQQFDNHLMQKYIILPSHNQSCINFTWGNKKRIEYYNTSIYFFPINPKEFFRKAIFQTLKQHILEHMLCQFVWSIDFANPFHVAFMIEIWKANDITKIPLVS